MNQELLSRAQQKEAAQAGAEARRTSQKRQLNRIANLGPEIKNLGDHGKALLHTADPSALPRKIAKTGTNALDTTVKSTVSIFKSTADGIKDTITKSGINPNIRNISFSVVGSLFGLSALKKVLELPKILTDKQTRDKSSPLILQGAKLLTGSALTLGLFKTVLGGTGLSPVAIGSGLALFTALNALSSLYENPNGVPSKLAKLFGLREKTVSLMDTAKLESTSPENIDKNV